MKHTPGPYTIEVQGDDQPFGYIHLWGMGGNVHVGYINKQPGQMDRILADAHLWKAAPNLLAAAKWVARELNREATAQGYSWDSLEALNEAIAQAEGEQSC